MKEKLCPSCGSCGFPMENSDDFAGGNLKATFCSTCANSDGRLKSYAEVVEANASYYVRHQGVDLQAARVMAAALIDSMPAWSHRPKLNIDVR